MLPRCQDAKMPRSSESTSGLRFALIPKHLQLLRLFRLVSSSMLRHLKNFATNLPLSKSHGSVERDHSDPLCRPRLLINISMRPSQKGVVDANECCSHPNPHSSDHSHGRQLTRSFVPPHVTAAMVGHISHRSRYSILQSLYHSSRLVESARV